LSIGKAGNETLRRKPLREIWARKKKFSKKALPYLTYAPIVSLGALVVWFGLKWLSGVFRPKPDGGKSHPLVVPVLAGAALAAFPQYFMFRPDLSHIAEFMPGCLVAMAVGGFYLGKEITWSFNSKAATSIVIMALLGFHACVYILDAAPYRYAGTMAVRFGRDKLFQAENGVSVFVNKEEFDDMTSMYRIIKGSSRPGEYVVCYPYAPGINFLTNRPTYEGSLYVDNTTRTANWEEKAITKFRDKKPAAIVISDWSINGSDSSMFSHWAPRAKAYIVENYFYRGTFLKNAVYTREPPVEDIKGG
jgi:hypothetical protein